MKIPCRRHSGFTLVEMLVVVTLIAIVATIAISLLGGASRDAAEAVNASNIKHLTSCIGSYQQLHDGQLPDKLDSLMSTANVAAGGSYTMLTSGVYVADNPGTLIYIGMDSNRDGIIDDTSYTSKGLDPAAWQTVFRSLTVTQLTTNDVNYLASIGITKVYDTTPATSSFHGSERLVERALQYGDPVLTVDPQTSRNGKQLYFDLGFHDIFNTTNYPVVSTKDQDLTADGRRAAMGAARFLVFGIGRYCTMIGDRKAGLQEAPSCGVVPSSKYNRYLMVVKMPGGPNDMDAQFAGILDSMGNIARSADSWATRTGN
jgi:prepilin-type N-terminal cleavage/methylation domain-containing protein